MRIAICDDERYWVDTLHKMVTQWALERSTLVDIEIYSMGSQLEEDLLLKHAHFDVIFLDIEFHEENNGIDISKSIRRMGNNVQIIFVSAYALKASEGYYVDALGFLVKPYEYKNVAHFLDAASKKLAPKSVKFIEVFDKHRVFLTCPRKHGQKEVEIYSDLGRNKVS